MRRQPYRGNPETKLVSTREDFSDGINITDSDDYMGTKAVRYAVNYDLDTLGALQARKGWGENVGLNYLFQTARQSYDALPLTNLPFIFPNSSDLMDGESLFAEPRPTYGSFEMENTDFKEGELYYMTALRRSLSYSTCNIYYTIFEEYTVDGVPVRVALSTRGSTTPYGEKSQLEEEFQTASSFKFTNAVILRNQRQSTRDSQTSIVVDVEVSTNDFGVNSENVTLQMKRTIPRVPTAPEQADPLADKEFVYSDSIKLLKIFKNEANIFERLTESASPERTISDLIASNFGKPISLELIVLVNSSGNKPVVYHLSFLVMSATNISSSHSIVRPERGHQAFDTASNNLTGIENVSYGAELFFTNLDDGMMAYNTVGRFIRLIGNEFPAPHHTSGEDSNTAYKPRGVQAIRTGFNVLGRDPLSWVAPSGISSRSIQGVYLTFEGTNGDAFNRTPTNVIPEGRHFYVNIFRTGTVTDMDIKFSSGTGDSKVEITSTITADPLATPALAIYKVEFLTQPSVEVEIEITFKGHADIKPHYEYYSVGTPNPTSKPVGMIDIGSHTISQMWDRAVYYKDDTLWYSDIARYDYVPHYNYITLNLSPSDRITNITYFRTAYIVFTLEKIFKITGHFDPQASQVELISDVMGCIAPKSVQMIDNQLIFLSSHGLSALKSERFQANMENIERIDQSVAPFLQKQSNAVSTVYRDQYMLHLNNNEMLDRSNQPRSIVTVGGRQFEQPDVIRYYKDTESFTFDIYEPNKYPRFILQEAGELYTYEEYGMFRRGDSDFDFGEPFALYVETGADNMDYPNHEKKFKQMVLKLGKESYQQPMILRIYADGTLVDVIDILPDSEIDTVELENSRFFMRKVRLSSVKCKNLAFSLQTDTEIPTSLIAVSYVYKLGKMR